VLSVCSFQIFVEVPTGPTVTLDVRKTSTVADIKQMLQRHGVGQVERQELTFGGREVENDRTLSESQIVLGSTLMLTLLEPLHEQHDEPMDSDDDELLMVIPSVH